MLVRDNLWPVSKSPCLCVFFLKSTLTWTLTTKDCNSINFISSRERVPHPRTIPKAWSKHWITSWSYWRVFLRWTTDWRWGWGSYVLLRVALLYTHWFVAENLNIFTYKSQGLGQAKPGPSCGQWLWPGLGFEKAKAASGQAKAGALRPSQARTALWRGGGCY